MIVAENYVPKHIMREFEKCQWKKALLLFLSFIAFFLVFKTIENEAFHYFGLIVIFACYRFAFDFGNPRDRAFRIKDFLVSLLLFVSFLFLLQTPYVIVPALLAIIWFVIVVKDSKKEMATVMDRLENNPTVEEVEQAFRYLVYFNAKDKGEKLKKAKEVYSEVIEKIDLKGKKEEKE